MHFQSLLYSSLLLAATTSALPQNSPTISVSRRSPSHNFRRSDLRKLNFKTGEGACDASQKATIQKSFEHALTMIDNVLETAKPSSLPFKTYIDNSGKGDSFDSVKDVFQQMQNLLTNNDAKLDITCNGNDDDCEFDTFAWAQKNNMVVNYCNNYFRSSVIGAIREWSLVPDFEELQCKGKIFDFNAVGITANQIDKLKFMPAFTTVHELSHLFHNNKAKVDLTDCYYGAYAAEYMALKNPQAAMGNADNYAWYAVSQYVNTKCANPDTAYLRASEDKTHFIADDSFHTQFDKLEAKYKDLLAAEKAKNDLAPEIAKLKKDKVEKVSVFLKEQERNGGDADKVSAKTRKEANDATDAFVAASLKEHDINEKIKKLNPDGDTGFCGTGKTWADVQKAMNKRKTKA